MREAIVAGIAEAIAERRACPGEVAVERGAAEALVRNRSGGVEGRAARRGAARARPAALRSRSCVLAAHPTTLGGKKNRLISGDWPGRFARAGSGRGARLFFQGALGDQSAALPDAAGDGTQERYGEGLSRTVDPPRPERAADRARLGFRRGPPAPAPGALPALPGGARTWSTARLRRRARRRAPARPAVLVFVPGEPVAEVGEAWRAEAGAGAEIVALAGGYVGYVERPEQIEARRGRVRSGPLAAARPRHRRHSRGRASGPPRG